VSEATITQPTGTRRPPPWVWPSIAVGLIYPALARSARLDVELLERLPDPPTNLRRLPAAYTLLLVGAAVTIPVLFSLLRLGITDIYSESMPFMVLALAIGMASPAAGLILVLVHIPLDLIAASGTYGQLDPLLGGLAGRAVSWWLLWLLVVAIPLMARALPGATLASGQPRDVTLRTVLAYAAGGLAAGVLLFMWTAAMPFMVRPAFSWTYLSVPTDAAIQPIQADGWQIILAGVLLLIGVTALRQRYGSLEEEAAELNDPDQLDDLDSEPLVSDQLEFAGRVATHILTVVVLGGLVSGALDVVLLFGAALVGQLVAQRLSTATPLGELLARIPWLARFLGGFALSYAIGLIVNNITFEPAFGSEFFPLVLTAALGLAIFQVLLGATAPPVSADDELTRAPSGAATAVVAGLLLAGAALFALPAVASANNCSSWGDCPATMEAVAAAGAGAAALVAVGAAATAMRLDNDRRRRLRRRRPRPRGPVGGGSGGDLLQRLRQRALGNYGVGRQQPFGGVGPAGLTPGELKLPDAGELQQKHGELKLSDAGELQQKQGELKLSDAGELQQKQGELKLSDAGELQQKQGELKLSDAGELQGKHGELKLPGGNPLENKE
jgi:hypothetical protein